MAKKQLSEIELKQRAIAEMMPITQKESDKVERALSNNEKTNIERHHRIGSAVSAIRKISEEELNKAGTTIRHQIMLLQQVHNIHNSTISRAQAFAEWIPLKQAVESNLTFEHFRLLLTIQDANVRQRYFEMARDQQWSTRTLEQKVQALKKGKHRRPDNRETTFEGFLSSFLHSIEAIKDKVNAEAVEKAMSQVEEVEIEDEDDLEDRRELVQRCLIKISELKETAETIFSTAAPQLEEALEKLNRYSLEDEDGETSPKPAPKPAPSGKSFVNRHEEDEEDDFGFSDEDDPEGEPDPRFHFGKSSKKVTR